MKRITEFLSLVKFSHSIFALPFALQAAWLASEGVPHWLDLLLIVTAAVAARTAAMAFNRLVDRRLDAANPRTAGRELAAGTLEVGPVRALVLGSCVVFVAAAFALNNLAGWLSFPVLAVLLGYSFVKRFSFLAHLVLGLALALAPLGAWIAVLGRVDGTIKPALLLALAVWTWVVGFDLIYACQDADHDRQAGLHSIPARFGIARALLLSRALHVGTLAALVSFTLSADLSWIYWISVGCAAVLLAWEHSLVAPDDLSRVDMAFFTLNGWIGVSLFLGLVLDRLILGA